MEQMLSLLRRGGVADARALGVALDRSQPTVSRALAKAGDRVVQIGRARRSRYAATRDIRGLGSTWPLYRINAQGRASVFGQLTAVHGDACFVELSEPVPWLRAEFADGLFPGLPWFLDDMRPQGFLGRQFVHRFARELGLVDDLSRWSVDAILAALLLRGEDAPSNFVLGEPALRRALDGSMHAIPEVGRGTQYVALAEAVMKGEPVGSSAAGEQPKFTACVAGESGSRRHVIVKFSGQLDGNPAAQRWADLLVAEHEAGVLLEQYGHRSAATEILRVEDRVYLESTRFDRVGVHGRRGVVTLAAWSDACDGERDNWTATASRMRRDDWIAEATVAEIQLRWWFGRLIGNSDMHFGNLAFFLADHLPLALTPSYDMLPMYYRPDFSAGMNHQPLEPPSPLPEEQNVWRQAARMARTYWQRLATHDAISKLFRPLAQANAEAITAAQQRFS